MHHAFRLSPLALASLLIAGTALATDAPKDPKKSPEDVRSYTLSVVQQKTETGFVRDSARSNDEGQSASGHVEFNADAATGTWTRASTHSGFDGKTLSRTTIGERHEGGFSSDTMLQDSEGRTASAHTEGTGDPETGAWTRLTTGSDFEGGSFRIEASGEKTADGLSRHVLRTNAQGQTASEDFSLRIKAGNGQRIEQLQGTNFDGSRYSRKEVSQGQRQGTDGLFGLLEEGEENQE